MKKASHENISTRPDSVILIIDKVGVIGEKLSQEYAKDYFVILITNRASKKKQENITRLRFKNKIPKVPRNDYFKILIIDNGEKEVKSYVNSIAKESKIYGTDIYFLVNARSANLKSAQTLIEKFSSLKILVFGDVFDNNIYFEKESSITRFLKNTRKNKKIIVKNDGLNTSFPITLEDTVRLIIKATFIKATQKIILLFYTTPVTDLSLAHMFQKIDPDIDVDFRNTNDDFKFSAPSGSVNAIKNYSLKNKLESISFDEGKKQIILKEDEKKEGHGVMKAVLFSLFISIFILLLPYLSTYVYLSFGYGQISSSHRSASNGDYEKAQEKAENATTLFGFAEKSNEIFAYQVNLVRLSDYQGEFSERIDNGINISKSMAEFFKGLASLENAITGISDNPSTEIDKGINALTNSYAIYQKTEIKEKQKFEKYIKNTYPFIEMIVNTKEVIPKVFGVDKEMSYIILFMNNTELLPGGGTIKAVGELRIKDYEIVSFNIFDPEEFKAEDSSVMESPYLVRRHLGEENSTIENSMVNLDFVNNAGVSSNIYKQLSGEDMDGVIGLDLYFLQGLLGITGSISVEGLEDEISAENLQLVIAENENDNLTAKIVKEVIQEIESLERSPYYDLFQLIGESIPEKHLFFAFRDSDLQSVFSSNKLSNSLVDVQQKESNEINDYFGLYEANFGRNHINYFISRSVEKINSIDEDGDLSSELIITYSNDSGENEFSSKNYKNYVQIALPLGTNINEISVGGQSLEIVPATTDPSIYEEDGFIPPEGIEIRQSVEAGLSIYSFLVVIPPDSVKNIKLDYSLPFNLNNYERSTKYSLKIFKQPGIDSYPFSIYFDSSFYNFIPDKVISKDIGTDIEINYLITEK